jgi:hypothetical protein
VSAVSVEEAYTITRKEYLALYALWYSTLTTVDALAESRDAYKGERDILRRNFAEATRLFCGTVGHFRDFADQLAKVAPQCDDTAGVPR